ncbi:MAG TPA: CrcB family protein, partial [Iamia sp.]|nr:CrcB family protein [Iamia sp.]
WRVDTRPSALAVVAAGGTVGALARWAIVATWPTATGGAGWGTLAVNLTGCLLLGVLAARVAPDSLLRLGLGTGVLGGFTTFSTLAVETDRGIAADRPALALGLLLATLVGGVGLALLGGRLGARGGAR